MAIEYPDGRGIRSGVWFPNEIFRDIDINFIGDAAYTNLLHSILPFVDVNKLESWDLILNGLSLSPNSALTLTLAPGVALSATGSYFDNEGVWGFSAVPGEIFGVSIPKEISIGFATADPTLPRMDMVEIRPIRVEYDQKPRNFKDPITGLVTTSPIETKVEYGYEFAVRTGTPEADPAWPPAKTPGWIKIAEVYIPAGTTTLDITNIVGAGGSDLWGVDTQATDLLPANRDFEIIIPATDQLGIEHAISNVPSDLNGHTLTMGLEEGATFTFRTISFSSSLHISRFYNGSLTIYGMGWGSRSTIDCNGGEFVVGTNKNLNIDIVQLNIQGLFRGSGTIFGSSISLNSVSVDGVGFGSINAPIRLQYFENIAIDTVTVTDTIETSYGIGVEIESAGSVDRLPALNVTGNDPSYHVRLLRVIILDSSNLVSGTIGEVDPSISDNYVFLDQLMALLP